MRLYNSETRQKFFDALYKNFIKADYDKSEIEKIRNTIFLHTKELENVLFAKNENEIQRYIGTDDIKHKFTKILNDVNYIKNKVDANSFLAFRETQFDDERDFIEVDLVQNGMEAVIVRDGQRVEISKITSDTLIVKEVQLAGGVEVKLSLLETGQFNRIFEKIQASTVSYLQGKYRLLYKLLYNAAIQNATIPYQTGANDLERTIRTINYAINTMKGDLYEIDAVNFSTPTYIYAHPSLESRLNLAMTMPAFYSGLTTSEALTSQPIQAFYTYELAKLGLSQNSALFVIPQVATFFAERIGAQVLNQLDVLSLSEILVVRSAIAAAVADVRVCRVVNFA